MVITCYEARPFCLFHASAAMCSVSQSHEPTLNDVSYYLKQGHVVFVSTAGHTIQSPQTFQWGWCVTLNHVDLLG